MEGLFAQLQQQLVEHGSQEGAEGAGEDGLAGEFSQHVNQTEPSPLVQTASAANQLHVALSASPDQATKSYEPTEAGRSTDVISTYGQGSQIHLDPQLQTGNTEQSVPGPVITEETSTYHELPSATEVNMTDAQVSMLQQSYSAPARGYGLLQRPLKRQARSRFSEERRKQVGGIRKMGACLRCRMLKKPCSGETPCATCRTIESARLWKNACIRTRIADEFVLYNQRLFYAKAHHRVNLAASNKKLQRPPGRIEATLFSADKVYASFKPMAAVDLTSELDSQQDQVGQVDPNNALFLIDFEADDMTTKLERYLVDETDKAIDGEESPFLEATLRTATGLISQEGVSILFHGDTHTGRYSLLTPSSRTSCWPRL